MFMTRTDEKSPNKALYNEIELVYKEHFKVKQKYSCKMDYKNAKNYGFTDLIYREWKQERILNADEYISYISTHCEYITLQEPYRTNFNMGIRKAICAAGNSIKLLDTIPLYLYRKPIVIDK